MRRVLVQHGEARSTSINTPRDQPMRWAKLKASGEVTYVGWLRGNQKGNDCGCVCPACGEDLQAVNVGKDHSHFLKPNTRGKFFRHPSGHQRENCSFLAAKLAALHLLIERGEIDLPPPRRSGVHEGASGATYTADAIGKSWRGRISDKVWLDSQSARITVDGRTVLVLLQARPNLSSDVAVDGVITIRVEDPTVASWEPEQILRSLQLDNGFTCWEKHWDDEALSAEAQRQAMAAAEEAMDRIPPELGELEGLSFLQKSETVLHAKVKEILSKAGRLRVPPCEQKIFRSMHDGSYRSLDARVESQSLTLTEVRLEVPLRGLVPDVICTARSSRNPSESFPLLIEVAVTHRVDESKKALIASRGLACIEIDLTLLTRRRQRITVDQLQSAVINDMQCKRWVFNPWLVRLVKSRELELARVDDELRKTCQLEEERQQWLDDLSTERLTELLLPALQHHWLTEGPIRIDDEYEVLPQEIADRLATRGFKGAQDPALLKEEGLLHCLENIRSCHLSRRSLCEAGGLWRLAEDPTLQKYLTLGLIAIKSYPLNFTPDDLERVKELRRKVKDSLKNEQRTYARPDTHDELISVLFPSMRTAVAMPVGTLNDLSLKIKARQAMERQKMAEAQRALQIEHQALVKELVEKERRRQRMDELLVREHVHGWKSETPESKIESVLRQFNVVRLKGNYSRSGIDVESLLRNAWQARASNRSFFEWIREQPERDAEKEIMMVEALRVAGLI